MLCGVSLVATAPQAQALDPGTSVELSWERMFLPTIVFGGKYDYTSPEGPIVDELKHGDGVLNGARIDFAYGFRTSLFGSAPILIGFKSFFSGVQERSGTRCQSDSDAAACDSTVIVDQSATGNNGQGFGAGDVAKYSVDRTVFHWGQSLDMALGQLGGIDVRGGLGHHAINQGLTLKSSHAINGFSQSYHEDLDTHYFGAFIGLSGGQVLTPGLALIVDAEGGLYGARTEYDGRLSQLDYEGPLAQTLSLDDSDVAFIGRLKLALEQNIGAVKLGAFVQGEFFSYVPDMAYNQSDRASGFPTEFSLFGRDGTRIKDDSAWVLSVGGRVSMPLSAE